MALKKSLYKNVYFSGKTLTWYSKVTFRGTVYNLGHYGKERDAVMAHDRFAIKNGLPTYILKKL